MRKKIALLIAPVLLASPWWLAMAQDASQRTTGTAGIDSPVASPQQSGIHRQDQHDSVLAGGQVAPLPQQSGDICALFPQATGCPAPPPPAPGGSGLLTTYGKVFGCATDGGVNGGGAGETLTFSPDGSWRVDVSSAGTTSGAWYSPTPAPAGWEIRITGTNTDDSSCIVMGTSTDPFDTGWKPLNTDVLIGAGAGGVTSAECPSFIDKNTVTFTATIRKISDPSVTASGSGTLCARSMVHP